MLFRSFIVILLIILIGAVLFRNKQEIDEKIALAEMAVDSWPVNVQEVTAGTYEDVIQASGVLHAVDEISINTLTQGEVIEVRKEKGEHVKKGEIIAQLNSKILQEELSLTQVTLNQAEVDLKRMNNLNQGEAITRQQLELAELKVKAEQAKLRSLKERLKHTEIRAGISGQITSFNIKDSQVVTPGVLIGTISDLSSLVVKVFVSSKQVLSINEGLNVPLTIEAFPGVNFTGKVTEVYSKPSSGLRFQVDVLISDFKEKRLLPGMFSQLRFELPEKKMIKLERGVILGEINDTYVFVVESQSAKKRSIKIGEISRSGVEIVEGLNPGELIIVAGQHNLTDGVNVKILGH